MDPVRKEIVVEAPVERAFRVFTERFDAWWPRDHHILQAPLAKAVMESGVGGRWYEVGTDGSQCDWGKVLVWDPPKRLVLAWQLNGDWNYDPDLVTELEIRFTPLGDMKTRVELEHRNLERIGEKAAPTRAALDSGEGWITHLTLFAKEAARA
jgi:uncharacterized protein YndB with AHSA1/START domain